MKKYFYTDGITNYGPFTLEELKEKNIIRQTHVWFQELGGWKPAGDVPELSELFKYSPPPIQQAQSFTSNQPIGILESERPPKTWLLESILATLFCCLPFGIAGIVNASRVESRFYAGNIDAANNASREAAKWTMISFWIGVATWGIYLAIIIFAIVSNGTWF